MLVTRVDLTKIDSGPTKVPVLVGALGPVLYGDYDENQLWFEFMRGTLFFGTVPAPTPPVSEKARKKAEKRAQSAENAVHATCPSECRQMFVHEKGVPQFTLPFHEHRKVANREYKHLEAAGFPGWERNDRDAVLLVRINDGRAEEVREWCEQNCRARYAVKPSYAVFQSIYDFALAKLMFQKDTT